MVVVGIPVGVKGCESEPDGATMHAMNEEELLSLVEAFEMFSGGVG